MVTPRNAVCEAPANAQRRVDARGCAVRGSRQPRRRARPAPPNCAEGLVPPAAPHARLQDHLMASSPAPALPLSACHMALRKSARARERESDPSCQRCATQRDSAPSQSRVHPAAGTTKTPVDLVHTKVRAVGSAAESIRRGIKSSSPREHVTAHSGAGRGGEHPRPCSSPRPPEASAQSRGRVREGRKAVSRG